MDVAQSIYDARIEAGLTQEELANLIGTTKSAISRLEDSNYEGHSLNMLRRIADALGKTVRVEFV
ncbi:MAG: helix-turn-helix transcriptional regulator [Cyanobacteria bacterium HKST-UBA02]|nr:helix-turn-helix transcriptional regulator [Cyanobacteria bacterium HKST-UBA02]